MGDELAPTRRWALAQAWEAAAEITAVAYAVEAALLTAGSRGRGPRPPKNVWEAKKMAVSLLVVLADVGYAEVGRWVGLHKDTVASHCAAVRALCADDEDAERRFDALCQMAYARLDRVRTRPSSDALSDFSASRKRDQLRGTKANAA